MVRTRAQVVAGRATTTPLENPEPPRLDSPNPEPDPEDPYDDPEDPDNNPQTPDEDPDQDPEANIINLTSAINRLADNSDDKDKAKTTRDPDPFDGSEPRKLRTFLLQLQLVFNDRQKTFQADHVRVNYALSYLKGPALEWFENDILNEDEDFVPFWRINFAEFRKELRSVFGPQDPVADAEAEIEALAMKETHRVNKYIIEFRRHSIQLDWGDSALKRRFYRGLPERIKDELVKHEKPRTLRELQTLAQNIDRRYWERRNEVARSSNKSGQSKQEKKSDGKTKSSSGNPSSSNSGNNPSNSSKTTTPASTSGNSGNSGTQSKKPDLTSKLGKDGKLTAEERQRRFTNNLCMFCGGSGHVAKNCTRATSSAAKAKARAATTAPAEPEQGKA